MPSTIALPEHCSGELKTGKIGLQGINEKQCPKIYNNYTFIGRNFFIKSTSL